MSLSDMSTPVLQASGDASKGKPGPALRKSCHFCRSRKIRCSGQSICSACRERNIECSYRVGGPKGRPRGPSRTSTEENSGLKSGTLTPNLESTQWRGGSPPKNSAYFDNIDGQQAPDRTVANNLQAMFNRLLGDHSDGTVHHSNLVIDAFGKQIPRGIKSTKYGGSPQSLNSVPVGKPISYEGLFFILAQELIEMLALRFSDLGCHQLEAGRSRYFQKSFMVSFLVLHITSLHTSPPHIKFHPIEHRTLCVTSNTNTQR
jgi:hypothetical protein